VSVVIELIVPLLWIDSNAG